MWNQEIVAKLEAERLQGLPRRLPSNTPEEIEKRRQLAVEMFLYNARKKA